MRAPALAVSSQNPSDHKTSRPNSAESAPSKAAASDKVSGSARSVPAKMMRQSQKDLDRPSDSDDMASAIEGLSLVKNSKFDTQASGQRSTRSGESVEDDQSHLSASSTKQQSFDTKSMASVTTFAMDEKESIRPDDSASVRAAEDDESSIVGHRDELSMSHARHPTRQSNSSVMMAPRRYHTLTLTNPPRFGDLPVPTSILDTPQQDAPSESSSDPAQEPSERPAPPPLAPDEKLLDALASPKDRLPLLQLEEKLLAFIANPA
jgi:hypothetical protein